MELIQTGIAPFDALLGGGLPRHHSIVVTGQPGSGKTILCSQIAFHQAARGMPVVIATITSEPHDKLLDELRGFAFFNKGLIGEELFVVSAYPWLQKGPRDARDFLLGLVRSHHAGILFVDGLRAVRDLWRADAKLRDFLYEMNVGLATADCLGLFTTEYAGEQLLTLPEATTVDGIISLSVRRSGARRLRRVEVMKMRGRPHVLGEHVMHIGPGGIGVVPRLESITGPDLGFTPTGGRARFGLPELDGILCGGLPDHSTTLIAGSTGVGKTLLALRFLAEGAAAGEEGLFLSFSEPPQRLVQRARAIGLDVQPHLDAGRLAIEYVLPGAAEADQLAEHLLGLLARHQSRRLVVDGIGEMEAAIAEPDRSRPFFSALIVRLRALGVTSLFLKEMTQLASPEIEFADAAISVTAENMLFLRFVELRGRLRRILSVIKVRESDFDPHLREFEISSRGIVVREPIRAAEGLLTGVPRLIEEMAP